MFKNIFAACSLIGFGLLSFNASAGTSSMPGAMCVKWNSSQPNVSLSYSKILNTSSTSYLYVDCPVVRTDFDSTFHDAGVEDSWVRVVDQNYNTNSRCKLVSYSHNSNGTGSVWSTSNVYSSGTNSGSQQLNTNSLNGENSKSHLYFSCRIPPRYNGVYSSLNTYQVKQ